MDIEILKPWLSLAGVTITALGLWWGGKRSARIEQRQGDQQWNLGLIDDYREEVRGLKQDSAAQQEEIKQLSKEIFDIREEMTRRAREHVAETTHLESLLAAYRQYVSRILMWIYQRIDSGDLAGTHQIPDPPEDP